MQNEKNNLYYIIYLLIWMALLMFAKWWKCTTKQTLNYIINNYNFTKNWSRFMVFSNIELKFFQINLILKLFMCLMLEFLKLF